MIARADWIELTLLFALIFLTAAGAQAQRTRTPTPLPPLPGTPGSRTNGINPAGTIVGTSTGIPFTSSVAIVWDRDGIPAPLPPLPGDFWSEAAGISPTGEIVGFSMGSGTVTAVVWR